MLRNRHFIQIGILLWAAGLVPTVIHTDSLSAQTTTATVLLKAGWNCYSVNVTPTNLQIEAVLASISGYYDRVVGYENGVEQIYDPGHPDLSALQIFNPLHGYFIHMLADRDLSVTGTVIPVTTPIPVTKGVNLVAYLPSGNQSVDTALESILDSLVSVKTIDPNGFDHGQRASGALSYYPILSTVNTLRVLCPGYGIRIETDEAGTLIYPAGDEMTLLASAAVGTEGGTVETGEFSLIVPANAFETSTVLSVYDYSGHYPFGNSSETRMFRVEGIPADFHKPLQVYFKMNAAPGDTQIVELGRSAVNLFSGDEETAWEALPAIVSGEYIQAVIPAGSGLSKINPDDSAGLILSHITAGDVLVMVFDCGGLSHFKYHTTQHFTLKCIESLEDYPELTTLVDYLEAACQEYIGMGFQCDFHQEIRLGSPKDPQAFSSAVIDDNHKIHILFDPNKLRVENRPLIRQEAAGAAFFVLMNDVYPDFYLLQSWLDDAVRLWAMGRFTDNPAAYIPPGFNGAEVLALNGEGWYTDLGLSVFRKENYEFRASMTTLIEFITTYHPNHEEIIPVFFQKLLNMSDNKYHSYHQMDAIVESLEMDTYEWYPLYVNEYLKGNIYNVQSRVFIESIKNLDQINIDSENLEGENLDQEYHTLSTGLFRINLNCPSIQNNKLLRFFLHSDHDMFDPDYVHLYVYSIHDDQLSFIDGIQGTGTFTIGSLQSLIQDDSDLLVAVMNSRHDYLTTMKIPIDLTVYLEEQQHMRAKIYFGNVSTVLKYEDEVTNPDYMSDFSFCAVGLFNGTEFVGTAPDMIRCPALNESKLDHFTIWYDLFSNVIDFSAKIFWDEEGGLIEEIRGSNVPCSIDLQDLYYHAREEQSESTCQYVQYLYWSHGDFEIDNAFSCSEHSYISIDFYPYNPDNPWEGL
ncbi:hypothetical protein JW835_15885 [bacterium]|nr:hypothetical protein [bacterium]